MECRYLVDIVSGVSPRSLAAEFRTILRGDIALEDIFNLDSWVLDLVLTFKKSKPRMLFMCCGVDIGVDKYF